MLEVCEYRSEIRAYSYFRWRLNRWEISFYKEHEFQFWIDLPFIHINNVLEQRVVEVADPDFGIRCIVKSITSGKVMWWKIKTRIEKKEEAPGS